MTVKLETSGLYKIYGDRPGIALELAKKGAHPSEILNRTAQMVAVSDVSIQVREGEIFTIMGLSGSGKSTLVRCLNRLIEPTAGNILIDDQDLCAQSPAQLRQMRRQKIAMVFQNFALLPHKTVVDNVEFGLKLRGEPKDERRSKALQALEQVGLSAWADRYPDNLSGGMKQRVGLARALASDADILLMDEPFSALDPLIRTDLQRELLRIQKDIRKTIIFITHDFHEAVKLSDHVAMMRDGKFIQVGHPEEIVLNPADEYVRNFARDLDRARVITTGSMSRYGVDAFSENTSAAIVLKTMNQTGKRCGLVIDEDRSPLGYVFRNDLDNQSNLENRTARDCRNGMEVRSAPASSVLIDVYPLFQDGVPLAILDSSNRVSGTVDASDILTHLGDFTAVSDTPLSDSVASR